MSTRQGYLIDADGNVREFEIPRGFASMRVWHLVGCSFHPTIYPGQTVRHVCPTGEDADRYRALEHALAWLRMQAARPVHLARVRAAMDELRPALEARANVIVAEDG